ncbi:MAG: hypothetical protein AAF383_30960, partial [Cyanobacteria bacterium P01_A01_bin.83]
IGMGAVILMSNATIANSEISFDYNSLEGKDLSLNNSLIKSSRNSFHSQLIAQAKQRLTIAIANQNIARGNLVASIVDYNQSYVDLKRQVSNVPDDGLQDLS